MPDFQYLVTGLIVLAGAGLFVRIVAKEKHRREKHLQWRLLEQARKQEQAAARRAFEQGSGKQTQAEEPIAAVPVH